MPFWLIIILIFIGICHLLLGIACFCNYQSYKESSKSPTGQVPVEEYCVIEKKYLNSYAK